MRATQAWSAGRSSIWVLFAIVLTACGGGNKGYLYYTVGDDVIRHDLKTGVKTSHITTHFTENDGVSVSDDASIFVVFGDDGSGNQQVVEFYDSSSNVIFQESNPLFYYHLPLTISPNNQCFLLYWSNREDEVKDLEIRDFAGNRHGVPYPDP